jgi:hypothetical protein
VRGREAEDTERLRKKVLAALEPASLRTLEALYTHTASLHEYDVCVKEYASHGRYTFV